GRGEIVIVSSQSPTSPKRQQGKPLRALRASWAFIFPLVPKLLNIFQGRCKTLKARGMNAGTPLGLEVSAPPGVLEQFPLCLQELTSSLKDVVLFGNAGLRNSVSRWCRTRNRVSRRACPNRSLGTRCRMLSFSRDAAAERGVRAPLPRRG